MEYLNHAGSSQECATTGRINGALFPHGFSAIAVSWPRDLRLYRDVVSDRGAAAGTEARRDVTAQEWLLAHLRVAGDAPRGGRRLSLSAVLTSKVRVAVRSR